MAMRVLSKDKASPNRPNLPGLGGLAEGGWVL